MDALLQVGRNTGVKIIEDCSHAHGARYKGKLTGSIGHAGAWSLQGSKAVSAGEGGVLATDDSEIFERACLAGQVNRMRGLDLATEKYADLQPLGLGMKFRAHPLGIGIATVQLTKLGALNERRRCYFESVESAVEQIPGLQAVKIYPGAVRGGLYAFPLVHRPDEHGGLTTVKFIEALRAEGLNASHSPYGLLHRLKIFARGFDVFSENRGPLCGDYRGYEEGDFPVTEEIFGRLVFLPVLSDPLPGAVDKVIGILRRVAQRAAGGEITNSVRRP
jgi:dTDP-4-amino-4,6-dideoxygalactose transaminase